MNLDSLTAALSHIGNLVASLTKKNLNSSVQEIQEVSAFLFIVCVQVEVLYQGIYVWACVISCDASPVTLQLDATPSPTAAAAPETCTLLIFCTILNYFLLYLWVFQWLQI